jgi:CelD/BcsL family acetyltransferase involved in cellulose biosynthesis
MSERTLSMASEAATVFAASGSLAPRLPAREASAGALDGIECFTSLAAAEPFWRELECEGVLTPYQRYEWVAAWHRNAGAAAGVSPLIVVGFDAAGYPLFLLPLGLVRRGSFLIARFLGDKHACFNFGPWCRGATISQAELATVIARIRSAVPGLDAIELSDQPESWEGMCNPMLALPHQPSPSFGYRLRLGAPGEEVLARAYGGGTRSKLRNKERKLQALPGYRYVRAGSAADVDRFLDAFLAQKAERFAAQGVENVFAAPGIEAFLREVCRHGLAAGKPLIEMHTLDTHAGMLALFAGVNDGRRYSAMITSFTLSEHARQSPGLVLLTHLVADCADRGLEYFDLGVGEAEFKTSLCDEVEVLFDCFLPLSPRGRLLAAGLAAKASAKRAIKRSPLLWGAAQKIRKVF